MQTNKSSKPLIIALVAIIVLLIVGIVVVVIPMMNKKNEAPASEADAREAMLDRGVVTSENAEQMGQAMQDKVADGYFECSMTMDWTFESGDVESKDAYVANAESNHYTICFDVVDDASGETWYKSPFIPVGEELTGIKLDKDLDPGKYEATVKYTLVDDENKPVSQCGFKVNITVNN